MPEEQPKATNCPNCQKPAIRSGSEITCTNCDAVFVITKKEGAKVKELGPLDDIRGRLDKLESANEEQTPEETPLEETEPEEPIL